MTVLLCKWSEQALKFFTVSQRLVLLDLQEKSVQRVEMRLARDATSFVSGIISKTFLPSIDSNINDLMQLIVYWRNIKQLDGAVQEVIIQM